MDFANLRNPYDYANPVRDATLFAGRGKSLAKLAYLLDQTASSEPVTYVALYGKRAAGKTSLLNMTEFLAHEREYITVRADLVDADSSPREFFTKVYEELIDAVGRIVHLKTLDGQEITSRLIRRIINGQLSGNSFPLEYPESVVGNPNGQSSISEMAFRADLQYLVTKAGRPIILLIDEAQVIADRQYILSVLRTIGTRLQGYMFIIAGTADLIPTINQVFGHLLRQFELIPVERFMEVTDVLDCITRPLAKLGLSTSASFRQPKETANDLMQLTDGNPYEIQLYCHVMFARWQNGAAERMDLSPEAIDDVRLLLEAGTEVQKHPIIAAIRAMSPVQLKALNILCGSLGGATIEELWFAHCVPEKADMTREDLDGHLNHFIETGIIEVTNGGVKFCADHFEEIYLRLWTIKQLDQKTSPYRFDHSHPQLISHYDFRHILTKNLEYLLCVITPENLRVLPTCCFGLLPSRLKRGIAELDNLPESEEPYYTTVFLHEAIVRSGIPAALDLIEVTCSYNGTNAVRWLYSADVDDLDIDTNISFIEAAARLRHLGGELRSDRTRIVLRPWPQLLDWLASRTSSAATRHQMSDHHLSASAKAYSSGDVDLAADHLRAAFGFVKSWRAANNLAYIMLKGGEFSKSLEWSDEAACLQCTPKELALSLYNSAMALVQLTDYTRAYSRLSKASETLASLPVPDYECIYLFVPEYEEDIIVLREESHVNLPDAVAEAAELVDVAGRLRGAKG